jgi:transcriptional regulator with XRE-family HTH domain
MTKGEKSEPALREILAANVLRLRTEMGLSQEVLGAMSGMHRTYVSQVERCATNVSLDNLERLAKVLSVPAHVLLLPTA